VVKDAAGPVHMPGVSNLSTFTEEATLPAKATVKER